MRPVHSSDEHSQATLNVALSLDFCHLLGHSLVPLAEVGLIHCPPLVALRHRADYAEEMVRRGVSGPGVSAVGFAPSRGDAFVTGRQRAGALTHC